ncbi:MAG: hypothetical protein N2C14_33290, partial [Planctomycetales bacterium]
MRFSLRTLFWMTAAAALVFAVVGPWIGSATRQRTAIHEILAAGGSVSNFSKFQDGGGQPSDYYPGQEFLYSV